MHVLLLCTVFRVMFPWISRTLDSQALFLEKSATDASVLIIVKQSTYDFQIIRMLAEKAKQQEELLVEYDENDSHHRDVDSEMELLRAQVDSLKDELKVGW